MILLHGQNTRMRRKCFSSLHFVVIFLSLGFLKTNHRRLAWMASHQQRQKVCTNKGNPQLVPTGVTILFLTFISLFCFDVFILLLIWGGVLFISSTSIFCGEILHSFHDFLKQVHNMNCLLYSCFFFGNEIMVVEYEQQWQTWRLKILYLLP